MATEDEPPSADGPGSRRPAPPTVEQEVESALARRLARVVESAVEVLGVDGIGLMLLDDHDALQAAGYTNPPTSPLEHAQAEIGRGPGIDAAARAETVAVADLAATSSYSALWRRLADTGVRAVLASPVRVWGDVVGNLNAVRHRAHRWTDTEIRANEAYAKVIGVTLDLAVQTVDAGRTKQSALGRRRDPTESHQPAPDERP